MGKYRILILAIAVQLVTSCGLEDEVELVVEQDISTCPSFIIESGKYYELEDQTYLWAHKDSAKHFNITNWTLNACNLREGIGRENFSALINPNFEKLENVMTRFNDELSAVVITSSTGVKVYPLEILVYHEAVNDVIDGIPILVVDCFLADLVTVYNRTYCRTALTFGVSGYTYLDENIQDGKESFILWDRNSESLWWPIIDRSVSGIFRGARLNKYNSANWSLMIMSEVKKNYPDAWVLSSGQSVSNLSVPRVTGC